MIPSIEPDGQYLSELLERIKPGKKGDKEHPHKYILLLTVIKAMDNDVGHPNRYYFQELEAEYNKLFDIYCPDLPDYSNVMDIPYYHLQTSGFWNLKFVEDTDSEFKQYVGKRLTRKRLLETVDYAYLSDDFFAMMQNKRFRELLKSKIVHKLSLGSFVYEDIADNSKTVEESASLFSHERNAITALNKAIESYQHGSLLGNVLIYDRQSNNYYEYDCILVARSGIYVIELKHWSGRIEIVEYNWLINAAVYRRDPHQLNNFKAKLLKGIYEQQFRTYPNVWAESVVILTNPDAEVIGADSPNKANSEQRGKSTFASVDDFVDYLKKRELQPNARALADHQIDQIAKYFQSLNDPSNQVKRYEVPGFETVQFLFQSAERMELISRSRGGRLRGLKRFRVFRPPVGIEPIEKERFYKKAYNTLDSVQQIGDHPNILKVWVNTDEDGNIVEASDWSEIGTLHDLLGRKLQPITGERALAICSGITCALDAAHQSEVIHRSLKPKNILMVNDTPKLMNFDLAYQLEENRVTVISDASKIKDDGYVAPEVLLGEDIDEATDFFSLGVIAAEMLGGKRPFNTVRQFMAMGRVPDEFWEILIGREVPNQTIEVLKKMIVADRALRLHDIETIRKAFNPNKIDTDPVIEANRILSAGTIGNIYEIVDLIGQGMETQVYKACYRVPNQGLAYVALKLFDIDVPRDRYDREVYITSSIDSAYVVRCNNQYGYWPDGRFYMATNFIEGNALGTMLGEANSVVFKSVAHCLFEAVRSFHYHRNSEGDLEPWLHSDIKPQNIIVTRDAKAVLIDCGIAGPPRVDVFQGTVGYYPPDNVSDESMFFNQSGDLYALGITLWEWLFGTKPYDFPVIGQIPVIPEDNPFPFLSDWLTKAVANEAEQRFIDIDEMETSFTSAWQTTENMSKVVQEEFEPTNLNIAQEKTEITDIEVNTDGEFEYNPFVAYLNSLSNTSALNENATAESQIGNPYFKSIMVENPLSTYIAEQLTSYSQNVILTGNAGDGKTTLAAEVYKKITGNNIRRLEPIEDLTEQNIKIIKDFSELGEAERIEILSAAVDQTDTKYLLISNTGTLLNSYKSFRGNDPDSVAEILKALTSISPEPIGDGKLLIVNLGKMNTIDAAVSVLDRILDDHNWEAAERCPYAETCPLLANVRLLQGDRQQLCERVGLVYRRLYEYGNRLTMRQMTGHLAYAITGGYDCQMIKNMTPIQHKEHRLKILFSNRFFGDDGSVLADEALQLMPVRVLQAAKLGTELDPALERELWSSGGLSEAEGIPYYEELRKKGVSSDTSSAEAINARTQLRRLIYFFGPLQRQMYQNYLSIFLRSPMLANFIDNTDGNRPLDPRTASLFLARILQVLQEFFIGFKLPEQRSVLQNELYVTLSAKIQVSRTQMVLARIPANQFMIDFKPKYTVGGQQYRDLVLRLRDSDEELILELPFLDYVTRRYQGEVAEEISVFYAQRLEKFKVSLLNRYSCPEEEVQMIRMGDNHWFNHIALAVQGTKLEVRT